MSYYMLTEKPLKSSLISVLLMCLLLTVWYLISLFFFSDMFLAAGEHLKAIEIIGRHGWVEKWVSFINFWNLEDWKQFDILEKYNYIDRAISFIIVGDQNSKQTKLQGEASAGKIITSTLSRPLMSRHFTYTKSNYTFALANFFFSSSHSDL